MRIFPLAATLWTLFFFVLPGIDSLLGYVGTAAQAQEAASEPALEEEVTLDSPMPASSEEAVVNSASEVKPEEPTKVTPPEDAAATQQVEVQEVTQLEEIADKSKEEDSIKSESSQPKPTQPVIQSETRSLAISSSSEGRLFGRKRVQIAVNKPTFTQNKEIREKLYGKPKEYPTLTGDWFPLDWWVNPGLSFRMGGYTATGRAAKGTPTQDQIDTGDVIVDENQKTTLLFIPLMAAAKVEMTPFRGKWLVLEGWLGYEYGWWQETRDTTAAISWRMATSDPVSTTKGSKTGLVLGGSANFLLNWLDERTVRSMVETMGISNVYISPFFEMVKSTSNSGISFNRNTLGVGFTFETFK